jgi:hypothetical protein
LFDNFGVLIESERFNSLYSVSSISLDFYGVICEKLQTLEYRCYSVNILANKFDATEFALQLWTNQGYAARVCKMDKKSILVGDQIQLPNSFESYCGRFLYCMDYSNKDQVKVFLVICLIFNYFRYVRFARTTSNKQLMRLLKLLCLMDITRQT